MKLTKEDHCETHQEINHSVEEDLRIFITCDTHLTQKYFTYSSTVLLESSSEPGNPLQVNGNFYLHPLSYESLLHPVYYITPTETASGPDF